MRNKQKIIAVSVFAVIFITAAALAIQEYYQENSKSDIIVTRNLGPAKHTRVSSGPPFVVPGASIPTSVDQEINNSKQLCNQGKGIWFTIQRRSSDRNDENYWDQQIIQVNSDTCEEVVVVPSVDQALPELKNKGHILSFTKDDGISNYIYYAHVLDSTDAPPADLYKFDKISHKLSKLLTSPYFSGYGTKVFSPDMRYLISNEDPENKLEKGKLFLVDLEMDTVRILLKVNGNETLDYCANACYWGNQSMIKWLDSNAIEYGVYDPSTSEQIGDETLHKLIEVRQRNTSAN